jgi:hypothetical protein
MPLRGSAHEITEGKAMRKTTRTLTALIITIAASYGLAQDRWLLRMNLEDGAMHRFAIKQVQRIHIDLGEMGTQTTETTSRLHIRQTVTEQRPDGTIVLESALERVVMDMNQGGARLSIDTDQPVPQDEAGSDPIAIFQKMVGKSFTVTLSSRAEVMEVSGFDSITDQLLAGMPENPSTFRLREMLDQGFSSDAMKKLFQQNFILFPAGDVGIGDEWTRRTLSSHPMLGNMDLETTFRVESAGMRNARDCVKIVSGTSVRFDGTIPIFDLLKGMVESQGGQDAFDVTVDTMSGEGATWIAEDSGLAVESEMNMTMGMQMTISIPTEQQEEADEMAIRFDMTMKMLTELLDGR